MYVALLLACLAGTAIAGPVITSDSRQCATKCTGSTKFAYELGKTYEYTYEIDSLTHISGSSEEKSNLNIKATVDIAVLSKCEMRLMLKDVSLKDSNPSKTQDKSEVDNNAEFKRLLEENPLLFSYQDGRIEEICATTDEDVRVLNIKRGVLSAFQISMHKLDDDTKLKETDVAGECDTTYKVASRSLWGTVVLDKSKDILGCTKRHGHVTSVQGSSYKVPSMLQSMPLMKTSHACKHTIGRNSRLQSAICKEIHMFRPFSKQENGAVTSVEQSLTFSKEHSNKRISGGATRRTNLMFEHLHRTSSQTDQSDAAEETLKLICDMTKTDIRPEVPKLFAQLVYNLRDLDLPTLRKLHHRVHKGTFCKKAKKFFLDAIPNVGSTGSTGLIKDLIMNKEATGLTAELMLTSLAFIAQPNKDMLVQLKPLLKMSTNSKTYLGVTSLVHSYCRTNPDCGMESEVTDIIDALETNLNSDCSYSNDKEQMRVLMSLKGLGNTGNAKQTIPTLIRCMENKKVDNEVRIAASQAFRRLPCGADRSGLLKMYEDKMEQVEMRIAAYLGAMQCPTLDIMTRVRDMFENEDVNQVGSFVWTHLTNLLETSCPMKSEIRRILENDNLKREFNFDKRKFSRNIEKSLFSETLNSGFAFESNVIWSPESFLPRSGMMNLTVDMFGTSVNLVELGGRVEGLEHILESYFGPNGYFPDNAINDILKRNKRSAIDGVKRLDNQYDPKHIDDVSGSGYLKIFGNEIKYSRFLGSQLKKKDSFNFLNALIELAKPHKVDFTQNLMLLDSHYVIPTIAGLPLNLSINATASVNLNIQGKLDIRKLGKAPRSMNIDGHIKPSGAVEVSSVMAMDAIVTRAGLKMVSTLHTSTGIDGKIELQDGKIFKTVVNMPKDKMEIIDVQTKFFIVHREKEREQQMITSDRITKRKCTGDLVKKIAGVQLCGEIYLPNAMRMEGAPFYPFTGPTVIKVDLEKTDKNLKSYQFSAMFDKQKKRIKGRSVYTKVAEISFKTPGSKIDRELHASVKLLPQALSVNLRTPWKKFDMNAEYILKNSLKRVSMRMTIDEKQQYAFVAELETDKRARKVTWTPNVELTMPGQDPIRLRGSVQDWKKRKLSIDLTLENAFKKPVTISGAIDRQVTKKKMYYDGSIQMKSEIVNAKLNGRHNAKGTSKSTHMTVSYTFSGKPTQTFKIDNKIRNRSTKSLLSYQVDSSFQSTDFKDYNFQVKTEYQRSIKHCLSKFDLRYGSNPKDQKRRVVLKTEYKDLSTRNKKKYSANVKVLYPLKRINFNMDLKHEAVEKEIKSTADITYMPGRKLNAMLNFKKRTVGKFFLQGDFTVKYPGRNMRLFSNIKEVANNEYSSKVIAQWQRGRQVNINSKYSKPEHGKHEVTSTISIPKWAPIKLGGELSTIQSNPCIKATLGYKGDKYFFETKYKLERSYVKANLDIKYPKRHITSEAEVSLKSKLYKGKFNLLWDADVDSTKMIKLEGEYQDKTNRKMLHHEGKMKVNYPGREALVELTLHKGSGDGKATTKIEWQKDQKINVEIGYVNRKNWYGNRDLEGHLKFTSPFDKYENIAMKGSHRFNGKNMKNELAVSWDTDKKVTASHQLTLGKSWKNIDTTLIVKTPFRKYRNTEVTLKNVIKPASIDSSLSAEVDGKRMEATLGGSYAMTSKGRDMSGELKVMIPYTATDVAITIKHADNSARFVSSATIQWAADKNVAAAFKMNHQLARGYHISNNGQIKITSPLIEDVQISWDHKNDAKSAVSVVDADWASETVHYKFEGNRHDNGIQGKLELQTPMKILRDLTAEINHEMEDGSMKATATVTNKGYGTYSFSAEGKKDELRLIEGKVRLTTPHKIMRDIGGSLKMDRTTTPNTLVTTVKLAPGRTITLTGKLDAKSLDSIEGEVRFTSPFKPVESLIFTLNHAKRQQTWESHSSFEWATGKQIGVASSFQMDGKYAASLNINTPFKKFEVMKVVFNHEKQYGKWLTDASVESKSGTIMSIESNIRPEKLTSFEGEVTMEIPLNIILNTKVNKVNVKFSHEGDLKQMKSHAEVTYLPRKKIEIDWTFNMRRLRSGPVLNGKLAIKTPFDQYEKLEATFNHHGVFNKFNTGGRIIYGTGKKIEFQSKFENRFPKVLGSLTVKSPFTKRDVEITFNHNGKLTNFKSSGQASTPYGKYEAEVQFKKTKGDILIKTPHSGYEKLRANFNHEGDFKKFTTKYEISWPGNKYTQVVSFENGDTLKGSMLLKTPIKDFETMEANFEHEGKLEDFKTSASVSYPNNKYEASTYGTFDDSIPMLKGGFILKTPFSDYKQIKSTFLHKGNFKNFRTTAKVEIPAGNYESIVTFENSLPIVTGMITIKSPNYEDMEAKFNHNGDLSQFETTASVDIPLGKYDATAKFENNLPKVSGSITITTPHEKYEKMELSFDHNGKSLKKFTTNLSASIPSQAVQVVTTFGQGYRKLAGSIKITGPIRAEIRVDHAGVLSNFKTTGEVSLKDETYKVITTFKNAYPKINGAMKVSTPIENYETMETSFTYNGKPSKFAASGQVSWPENKYSIATRFDNKWPSVDLSVNIKTPIPKYTNIDLVIDHNVHKVQKRCKTIITLNVSGKRYEVNAGFNNALPKITASLLVKTPFKKYSKLLMTLDHNGKAKGFVSTGKFTMPGKVYEAEARYRNALPHVTGSLEVKTPHAKYDNMKISFKHNGYLKSFTTNGQLSLPGKLYKTDVFFRNNYPRRVTGNLKLVTPFKNMKQMSLKFNHIGKLTDMKTTAEFNRQGKKYEGTFAFKTTYPRVVQGSVTLKTPHDGYEKMAVGFTHKGKINNCNCNAYANLPLGKYSGKYEAQIKHKHQLKKVITVDTSIGIKTPISKWKKIDAEVGFKHQGDLNDFKTSGDLLLNKDKYAAEVLFKNKFPKSVESKVSIKTPFKQVRNLQGTITHNGKRNGFKTDCNVLYNGKKYTGQVSHMGSLKSFKTKVQAVRGREKYNADVSFSTAPYIKGTATITSPLKQMRKVSAVFTHNNFKTSASLTKDDRKMFVLNTNLDKRSSGFNGVIKVNTPFDRWEKNALTFSHKGDLNDFQTTGLLETSRFNDFSGEVKHTLSRGRLDSSAKITTPFTGYEKFSGQLSHRGNLKKFTTSANVETPFEKFEKMSARVSRDGMSGNAAVSTSYAPYESFAAKFNHKGSLKAFTTTGEITTSIPGYDRISTTVKHSGSLKRGIESGISVETPFDNFNKMEAELLHKGTWRKFNNKVTVNYMDGKKIEGTSSMEYPNILNAKAMINIKTPFPGFEDMTLKSKNSKRYYTYGHDTEIAWSDKKISLKGKAVTTRQRIPKEASLEMTTPWKVARQMSVKLSNAQFKPTKVSTNLEAKYLNEKKLDMKIDYTRKANKHTALLQMQQPHPFKFTANGDLSKSRVNAETSLNWNTLKRGNKVSAALDFNNRGRRSIIDGDAKAELTTPYRTVQLSGSLKKNGLNIKHKGMFSWNTKKQVSYEFNMDNAGSMSGKLITPLRTLALETKNKIARGKYSTDSTFSWDARNKNKKIGIVGKLERLTDGLNGELQITSPKLRKPISIKTNMRAAKNLYSYETTVEYDHDQDKKLTLSGEVGEKTPNNYTLGFIVSHPSSKVDIRFHTHAGANEGKVTSGLHFKYLNHRGQNKIVHMRSEINKARSRMNMEMNTPWTQSVEINGKMKKRTDGSYNLQMSNLYGKSRKVTSELDIDPSKRSFDMKSFYSPDNRKNMLHVYGKYINASSFHAEAYRNHENKRIVEGVVAVNLKNARLLHGKLYWRPEALDDFQGLVGKIGQYAAQKSNMMQNDQKGELTKKLRHISNSIRYDAVRPIGKFIMTEMTDLSNDLTAAQKELARMASRDEFYMKTMNTWYSAMSENLSEMLSKAKESMLARMTQLSEHYDQFITVIGDKWDALTLKALEQSAIMMKRINERVFQLMKLSSKVYGAYISDLIVKFNSVIEPMAEKYVYYYNKAQARMIQMRDSASQKMAELKAAVIQHPITKNVQKWHSDLMQQISEIPTNGGAYYINKLRDTALGHVSSIHKTIQSKYGDLVKKAQKQLEHYRSKANAHIETMDFETAKMVMDTAKDAYKNTKWAYKYYKVEENAKKALNEMTKNTKDYIKKEANAIMLHYSQFNKTRVIEFDPKRGKIQGEVFLPIGLKNINTLPNLSVAKYVTKLKSLYNTYVPRRDWTMSDYYHYYKPSSDVYNWVPPFKTHATILGRQHIMTFDKKHYEFAGDCSYLLARDFIDGNWSVMVNYANGQKKSIQVISNDKLIEILPDFTVKVDGVKRDMPYEHMNTTIFRVGHDIRVDNEKGVTVQCDITHDFCTVNMTGWYHGKTAGLFGTYDNEPSTDFTTSKGTVVKSVEQFAHSWKVNSCYNKRNMADMSPVSENSKVYRECAAFFNNTDSSFRKCYKIVNPSDYMSKCLRTSVCSVSALYISDCKREGVEMKMPSRCIKCSTPNGELKEGEEYKIDSPPQSADVVFVVEEKKCNKALAKKLKFIVKSMEIALGRKNIKNNRYAIVGFGGKGVHNRPNIHTTDSKMFVGARKFTASKLVFDDGDFSDALIAIDMATKLPFRQGVKKEIILFSCSRCHENTLSYSEVAYSLSRNNIVMHVLTPETFKVPYKGNINIFGFDAHKAYTTKDSLKVGLRGNKDYLRQIAIPKDICIVLAQNSEGSVFNSEKLTESRVSTQRKFNTVLIRRIAMNASPSKCQLCKCEANDGIGRTVCRRCTPNPSGIVGNKGLFSRDLSEFLKIRHVSALH